MVFIFFLRQFRGALLTRDLNSLEVLCALPLLVTHLTKSLRPLLFLQKEMFSSAPVQMIYQLSVMKYKSTDLRPLVKDIKNHDHTCKHKFFWIIFYWSMFRKFTYRLNLKYTKCQSVYILMPSHCCCVWIGFRAGAFSSPLTKTLQQWGLKEILVGHRHAGRYLSSLDFGMNLSEF